MQRKRNIRLLIVLVSLIIITIANLFIFNKEENELIADNQMFAVADVSEIDSVIFENKHETIALNYQNGEWVVNGSYAADPQKLTVLFAVLNQVRAKRPVAEAAQEHVDSLFQAQSASVRFYHGDDLVKGFSVAGSSSDGISYFRNEEDIYIVNIPGYRSYIAAIFLMKPSEWRNKLIFEEVSWNNLEEVTVEYPQKEDYTIVPQGNYFTIENLQATDSLKLLDYLDRVSLLMADEYLDKYEVQGIDSLLDNDPLISMTVSDIRNRPFTLSVYPAGERQHYVALQDSSQWLFINKAKIDPLLRERQFFRK